MDQPQIQPDVEPHSTTHIPSYFFLSLVFFVAGIILFVYSFKMKQSRVQITHDKCGPTNERCGPTKLQIPKKENNSSPQVASDSPDGAASKSVALTSVTELPPGYNEKDTICYRMFVPNTSVLGAENSCTMYFSINRSFPLSLKVDSEYIDNSEGGNRLIDYVEKRIIAGEVLKNESTVIDGLTAQLIVEKTHPTNGDEIYRMFVDVSPKEFEVNGYPIGVLEFSSVIVNGDHKKEALNTFNTIIGSIVWK